MLELLVYLVGYSVARLVLPLFSFGKVHVAPLASPPRKFNLIGCRRDESGRVEVDPIAAEFIGAFLCVIGAVGLAFVIRASI